MNTVVPSVAGSVVTGSDDAPPADAVHSGLQTVGVPGQFVDPSAAYACSWPASLWMNTRLPETATDDGVFVVDAGSTCAVQTRCSVVQSSERTARSAALKPVWTGLPARSSQPHAEHASASAATMTTSARRPRCRVLTHPPADADRGHHRAGRDDPQPPARPRVKMRLYPRGGRRRAWSPCTSSTRSRISTRGGR